jgi:hypothetical protein
MGRIVKAFNFASYANKNTHPNRKFMAWEVCYEGKNCNVQNSHIMRPPSVTQESIRNHPDHNHPDNHYSAQASIYSRNVASYQGHLWFAYASGCGCRY